MNLTRLEKAAVISTAAAAAYKVLLWSVGATLALPAWWQPAAQWLFAGLSFVSFDLVVLAIVADQRTHGRRILGTATATMAAGLSGAIALHVAGVVAWPWLHAGPALLLLLLALHLSDTRPAAVAPPATITVNADQAIVAVNDPVAEVVAGRLTQAQAAAQLGVSRQAIGKRIKKMEATS